MIMIVVHFLNSILIFIDLKTQAVFVLIVSTEDHQHLGFRFSLTYSQTKFKIEFKESLH